ncbi:MAG: DNA polymerase III subunit delta [Actinobacteria bacterium]|nr:DNA polymerase III subunit delta [Actinomycetota bacterium]
MTVADKSKQLTKIDDLKPCHLYISKSSSVLDDRIDSLKKFLKTKINFEVDFKIFYGGEEIDEGELVNFYNTPSFFSEKKVAVIKNIEKVSKNITSIITSLLSNPEIKNFSTVLVITALEENSSKKKINPNLLEAIKKIGVIKKIDNPLTSSLRKWVDEKSELDGIKFTNSAAVKLTENVNFDINLLRIEYEKLYTFIICQKDKIINEMAVDRLVDRVYDMKIFDLVDYIGERDRERAIVALKPIMMEKNPNLLGLITLVHRMFKAFMFIKSSDRGNNIDGIDWAKKYIQKHIGHSPYIVTKLMNKYIKSSKKYSRGEIAKVFGILSNYDVLFRTQETATKNLIMKMISEITDVSG